MKRTCLLLAMVCWNACGDDDANTGRVKVDAGAPDAGAEYTGRDAGQDARHDAGQDGSAGDAATSVDKPTYAIGGEVTGLAGELSLQNGDEVLKITQSGDYTFKAKLMSGDAYDVTVKAQPLVPSQTCSLSHADGTVATSNVSNIDLHCVTNVYYVGGTISGAFDGLTLLLNDRDFLSVSAEAESFKFPTLVSSGAPYEVKAVEHSGYSCRIRDASGSVSANDVASIKVACEAENRLDIEPLFNAVLARWDGTGANDYTLRLSTAADCDFDSGSCPGFREIAHATSPVSIHGLSNGTVYYFDLKASHDSEITLHARSAARPNAPVFDGDVLAIATAENTTYVAGDFTQLRVRSGAAVPLDWAAGLPSTIPNFPIVVGEVYAVAHDGNNGYYVGGQFTRVGAEARSNIAHVKSDGSVDTDWNPGANGAVRVLQFGDSTLYVAGEFATIASQARAGLAAFDAAGAIKSWDPSPNGPVSAIKIKCSAAPVPCDVIVAGSFSTIVGMPRANLALVKAQGSLQSWAPDPDGAVDALDFSNLAGFRVFVGGRFQMIAGQSRKYLAAVNWDGTLSSLSAEPDQRVSALTLYQSADRSGPPDHVLYVAGPFTSVSGTSRPGLAALDLANGGSLKSWNPQVSPAGSVRAIYRAGGHVYLGGTFNSIANTPRYAAAAVSTGESATLASWNPNPDGPVHVLASAGGGIFVAGAFQGLGGVNRARLAAFESTGEVSAWNPGANDTVEALALSSGALYVGGAFTQLGGEPRNRIGAFDASGALRPWNPSADDSVYAFAVVGTALIAGGAFSEIGGAERSNIAALDSQGAAIAWNPELDGDVRALLVDATTVYAAGDFSNVGSDARRGIAAIDGTGAATAWDPESDGAVHALALFEGQLVVAGSFTGIGAASRPRLAALDPITGLATSWAPAPNRAVRALAVDAGELYVVGNFLTIGGEARTRVAVYDDSFTLADNYAPQVDGEVHALAVGPNALYLGGEFAQIAGGFASRFGSTGRP